jgi:cell division protein FtsB
LAAVLILILGYLQYELWFGDRGLQRLWRLQSEIAAQSARNAQAVERNRALEAEVDDLEAGLEAVEERARSELGMIRDGEIFIQVLKPEAGQHQP